MAKLLLKADPATKAKGSALPVNEVTSLNVSKCWRAMRRKTHFLTASKRRGNDSVGEKTLLSELLKSRSGLTWHTRRNPSTHCWSCWIGSPKWKTIIGKASK